MKREYDLKERTLAFAESVIKFVKNLDRNEINRPLISQVIRSSASIGANYMEADGAESRRDFQHKIAICRKEAKETNYWLNLLMKVNTGHAEKLKKASQEAEELSKIFSSIIISSKKS